MPGHSVIVIGASRGGLYALRALVPDLPSQIQAALFVVQHIGAHRSALPDLLGAHSPLPIIYAADEMTIEQGCIYIAPPDRHMVLERGHIHLSRGPKENFTRPAINPLFRSAAVAYGAQTVGVILSGSLDDGAAGLWEIKRRGGVAVVQHPTDATYPSMPQNALKTVQVDYCVGVAAMPLLLARLATESAGQHDCGCHLERVT